MFLFVSFFFLLLLSFSSPLLISSVQHTVLGTASAPVQSVSLNLAQYLAYGSQASSLGVHVLVFPESGLGWGLARTREEVEGFCEDVPSGKNQEKMNQEKMNQEKMNQEVLRKDGRIMNQDISSEKGGNRSERNENGIIENQVEENQESLCGKTNTPLGVLSCMAEKLKMVVIFNTCDRKVCTEGMKCNEDGLLLRNTEVVLGADGRLITRYYKAHLFGEAKLFDQVPPAMNDIDTAHFKIFNVSVGLMTCFDSEFVFPAKILHEAPYNIEFFIMSSAWMNTPPVLTAASFQQAWSRAYKSTLIVSNVGNPLESGGGIYSNGAALSYISDPVNNLNNLTTANLTLQSLTFHDEKSIAYPPPKGTSTAEVVPCVVSFVPGLCTLLESDMETKIVVNNDFACAVSAIFLSNQTSDSKLYAYASAGNTSFPNTPNFFLTHSCAIISCASNGNYPIICSSVSYDAAAHVDRFRIQAEFAETDLVFPVLMTQNGQLISDPSISSFVRSETFASFSSAAFNNTLYTAHLMGVTAQA